VAAAHAFAYKFSCTVTTQHIHSCSKQKGEPHEIKTVGKKYLDSFVSHGDRFVSCPELRRRQSDSVP
jgi:hypothetical protein